MSGRYSHGGGDYRHGGGDRQDYRQGGYNNGHRNGGYPYGKINEDDVPESQHSIFVRGLPSSVTYDEIKSFFEEKIGPCSFDFQKVNYERQSLFVAVRFETKEHAKEAYNKYRDEDILGCRCEVTWFRDIRRYISYQQQTGGVIRRGSFGRGQSGRYQTNPYLNKSNDYRKRRYSDDRRSRSRSYSDSDRSRSRSRRSSKSRSSRDRSATWNSDDEKPRRKRSRSRSEGERSSSRDSDRRRSESKDDKRKDRKKEKKTKKTKKERRGRRSESASSRSDGERSRSSSRGGGSDRDASHSSKKRARMDRRDRDASPASSTGSPLRMTPPPPAPTIIGPIIPTSTSTPAAPVEKPAPLSASDSSDEDEYLAARRRNEMRRVKKDSKKDEDMEIEETVTKEKEKEKEKEKDHKKIMITIANKATVPVENTSFKMALDSDDPPRKIVRGPLTPEKKDDDVMDIEEKEEEEEVPLRKETPAEPKDKGGWRTVGSDNSGPPSDVISDAPTAVPPAPTLIQPTLATPLTAATPATPAKSPEKAANGIEMVPRSVNGPPPPAMGGTPNPPPKRPPMGTPSSLPPPPPGRPSLGGGGGALALKCPEMSKTIREIKAIQDQLIASVKHNPLRLSDLSSNSESALEKMEEREKLINELEPMQKTKFDIKMKQIANSYRGDASTITTVIKSVVQKDSSLEEQIKPALLEVLEDLEKQVLKKVDEYLTCGL